MNAPHIQVEIEATNLCNTRCLHCPHELLARPLGRMDKSTYQIVLDKVSAYTSNFDVDFAGMGEPLLNPSIYDFVSSIAGRGSTTMTTNASALTPQNARRLIEAGLSWLTISFNGDESQIYETMMGGLSFGRAEQNLHTMVELSQGTCTTVAANVSVTRQTQPRLASIKRYLNDAGVTHIYFSKCHSRGGFMQDENICDTPMPPADTDRCDIFSNTIFVAWTGEVLSCCHDLAGSNVLGDLKTDTIESILEKKQQISAAGVRFEICKYCNDLYRFMKDQTPDGPTIAEWVYDLYAGESQTPQSAASPLSEWIYNLYAQEGRQQQFFSLQDGKLRQYVQQENQNQQTLASLTLQAKQCEEANQALKAENQELKGSNQALKRQIEAVHSSRTWRLLDRLNRFRRRLVPLKK